MIGGTILDRGAYAAVVVGTATISYTVVQHDTLPVLTIALTVVDTGAPVDLTGEDVTVSLYMRYRGGDRTIINADHAECAIAEDETTGIVTYTPVAGDFAAVGHIDADVMVVTGAGEDATRQTITKPLSIYVREAISPP